MKRLTSAMITTALLWSTPVAAQRPLGGGFMPSPFGPGRGVDILRVEPLDTSGPVLNIPFSADTVTEVTQPFADGNRVEQRATGHIARDVKGRIRREQTLAGLRSLGSGRDVRMVTIASPAEGLQYWLDDTRKIAWRLSLLPLPRGSAFESRPDLPPRPGFKTESLAPAQFEGLRAEGTRTTVVLPVGAIGNQRTIEVMSERWYAPDIEAVVYTQRTDPRFGHVTYRLSNITRDEPSSDLFEVPPDFTIREQRPLPPGPR